jgi:hypothetical protein
MESHAAAALRSVVERQGNEMVSLRAAAAAAEAESVAAKKELAQVSLPIASSTICQLQ